VIQSKVQAAFRELFNFSGQFQVSKRESGETPTPEIAAAELPEIKKDTLLNIKKREKIVEKQKLAESVKQDPFTQEVIKTFDAQIEDVNVD